MTLSADTQALMAFEAGKKSTGVSYALWFFLGAVGAHRFYNGKIGTGVAQVLCLLFCWLIVPLVVLVVWVIVDAFLIPGWVRSHNLLLMSKLGASKEAVLATAVS